MENIDWINDFMLPDVTPNDIEFFRLLIERNIVFNGSDNDSDNDTVDLDEDLQAIQELILNDHAFIQAQTESISSYKPIFTPASEHVINEMVTVPKFIDSVCTICYDDDYEDHQVIMSSCGHCFHYDCMRDWLLISDFCPVCRLKY